MGTEGPSNMVFENLEHVINIFQKNMNSKFGIEYAFQGKSGGPIHSEGFHGLRVKPERLA